MKAVSNLLKFVTIVLGTVFLTRALYTTEIGGGILRLIPDSTWNLVYGYFRLEGAETTANIELAVWLFICFAVSAAFVLGGSRLFQRFFTSDKHRPG